eukprot:CAMPEP_0174338580 /NCGR_PEP_ID=MMETSP0810-20121108/23247_1 /TAXON_ID=73025 ORGANISM="Eutreptiella gymnastica-like, Strain CCMP1594" /NCGR_SAMPLE_ID=MMETSP0810 /ASSEMBLY_ACC=CAM_ASM_000659 /LENGTH=97 /DNA_ID=CAMNT_0015458745 /DNA_START=13 /DNA_END=303 /DNA_ORIENTATION=+
MSEGPRVKTENTEDKAGVVGPSDDALVADIQHMLSGDMEDLSVKKVIERLEKKFNCSLLERKPFIKETINRILEEQHEQEGEKEDSGSDSSSSSSSS